MVCTSGWLFLFQQLLGSLLLLAALGRRMRQVRRVGSLAAAASFDAVLSQELLGVSSATWQLSGNFRRGKTAIPDGTASHVDNEEKFLSMEESKTLDRLFSVGAEKTFSDGKEEILKESASAQDFLSRILGGNQK